MIRLMRNILGINPTDEGSLGMIYFGVEFSNWGKDFRKCLMVTGQQLRGPDKTVNFCFFGNHFLSTMISTHSQGQI